MKMEEFVNKLGIMIVFTPEFSPWSNGVNERSHYSCNIIVKKAMEEDKKLKLQTAVNMAHYFDISYNWISWNHFSNYS